MVADVTENDVSVYPNPAVGMVHVEAENLRHISVFNELGQNVFETSADGDEFEFDLTGNEAGIYLIRIETAIGTTTKRIVLTK
jgi:hypothetical protein